MILNLKKLKDAGFHVEQENEDLIHIHGESSLELNKAYASLERQLIKSGIPDKDAISLIEGLAEKANVIQIINICSS